MWVARACPDDDPEDDDVEDFIDDPIAETILGLSRG